MYNSTFSRKTFFVLLVGMLFPLSALMAQPDSFATVCDGDGRNSQPIQAVIQIGGENAVPNEDYVALFDSDGFVVGVGTVVESSGFCGPTAITLVNFGVFGVPPNDDANCVDGYGANDDEVLTGLIYDGSEDLFYVLPGDLTYVAGGLSIIPSGDLCTPINATALPAALTAFRGEVAGPKHIRLDWDVAREENVSHYEVQRSLNGRDWNVLEEVTAAGNSEGELQYSFDDLRPEGLRQFYRLRMVDLDGAYEFSGIVITELSPSSERTVNTFPNPATPASRLSIQLGGEWKPNAPINASLYDLNGRLVKGFSPLRPGTASVAIPGGLKQGVYLLRVTQTDAVFTHKIIMQ